MNLKLIALCTVLVSQTACWHDKKLSAVTNDSVAVKKQYDISKKKSDSSSASDTMKPLATYNSIHAFSDPVKKDTFSLVLYRDKRLDLRFILNILSYDHQVVYRDTFDIGDRFLDTTEFTKAKEMDSTRVFAAHFLDSTNFSQPAISQSGNFQDSFPDADNSEKKEWEEIKADHSSIGFTYEIGNESAMTIAFSKKRKKVMVVFYSD
ncbi:MAG TPA: hypothetical protein VGN20_22890 [Mucilaginibacter sp.]|jgi:hypothetical protein